MTNQIRDVTININGTKIKPQPNCNYLGIQIDENLKWDSQITNTIKKIQALVPITYSKRNMMNKEIKKIYYHAMIESRLTYSMLTWARASKGELKRMQRKQNNILRILYNKHHTDCIDEVYNENGIMRMEELLMTKLSKKAWKLLKNDKIRGAITLTETEKNSNITLRNTTTRKMREVSWNTRTGKMRLSRLVAKTINIAEQKSSTIFSEDRQIYPKEIARNFWCNKNNINIENLIWE